MKPLDKLALKINLDDLANIDMAKLKPCRMDIERMQKIIKKNVPSWSPFDPIARATDGFPLAANERSYLSSMEYDCRRMADKIKDVCKCIRRALAAEEIIGEGAAQPFYDRANDLLKGGQFNVGAYVDKR